MSEENSVQQLVARSMNRSEWIEIQLLNENDNVVSSFTGIATGGSITLTNGDSSNFCRLSGNLELKLTSDVSDDYFKINLKNKCKVFKCVRDNGTKYEAKYNLGIALMNNPQISRSNDENKLTVELSDLFNRYNGIFGGSIDNKVKIEAGGKLVEVLKDIATNSIFMGLNGNKVLIENNDYEIPYDIEVDAGSNISDLLSKLMELYLGYELFFNQDGVLIYQKIKDYSTDIPIEILDNSPIVTSYSEKKNFENVRNKVTVLGAINDSDDASNTTYQYLYTATLDKSHPFSKESLNEERKLVITNDKDTNNDMCKTEAEYNLELHNNYANVLNLTMGANYRLIPNRIIEVKYKDDNLTIDGRYLITTVNINLVNGELMSLECNKMYNAKA